MKRFPPGYQASTLEEPEWFKDPNPLQTQQTFFPIAIGLEDIDQGVMDWFVEKEIKIDGKNVPVFFLTPEKWAEFKHSWTYTDQNHNIKFPYITVRRTQAPRLSQNPVKGRVVNPRKFTTYKIPYYDNNGMTYKFYKVPQPIKVELEYEIRALTHYMTDINQINEAFLRHFASLHSYLNIQQHYMPMKIENVSDESDYTTDLSEERIIHTLYTITVQGYLIDKEEFEEKIGLKSTTVSITEA